MSKISELSENVKQDLLHKLSVDKILEKLSQCDFYESNDCFTIQFTSDHPLFEFYYWNSLLHVSNDTIEYKTLKLNYLDCLELLQLHFEQGDKHETRR